MELELCQLWKGILRENNMEFQANDVVSIFSRVKKTLATACLVASNLLTTNMSLSWVLDDTCVIIYSYVVMEVNPLNN